MKHDAFNPQGPLVPIVAAIAASAPTPVQLITPLPNDASSGIFPASAVEVTNSVSGADAWLVYASSLAGAAAIAAAGIPAIATEGVVHLPAGSDKVYSLSSDQWYTAICASGTSTLYLLPGSGL